MDNLLNPCKKIPVSEQAKTQKLHNEALHCFTTAPDLHCEVRVFTRRQVNSCMNVHFVIM